MNALKQLLIIDDDDLFREALKIALVGAGYRVVTSSNGALALERLQNEKADIVIVDILMPEKDGLETLREIRRLYPSTAVIAISGGGQLTAHLYMNSARLLGARATLLKPFSLEQLLEVIKDW